MYYLEGYYLEHLDGFFLGYYSEHLDEFFCPTQRAPDVWAPDTPPVDAGPNMPAVAAERKGKRGRENTRQRCIGV